MIAPIESTHTKRERLDSATYKVPQVADLMQVSQRHVWRMIDARTLPGVIRLGRSVRIAKSIFDKWLSDGGPK